MEYLSNQKRQQRKQQNEPKSERKKFELLGKLFELNAKLIRSV